jgi:hypothetical protein
MKTFVYVVAVIWLCFSPENAQAQGRSNGHGFFGGIVDRVEKGARGFGRTIRRVPDRLGFHGQSRRAKPRPGIGTSRVNSAIIGRGHRKHSR